MRINVFSEADRTGKGSDPQVLLQPEHENGLDIISLASCLRLTHRLFIGMRSHVCVNK